MSLLAPEQALEAHLEWSEGPWLGFVFAEDDEAVEGLRRHVSVAGQQILRPATPQQLREGVPRLLSGPTAHLTWVQAVFTGGLWGEAADWFLLRANERRQPLLRHLGGGLLVVLPVTYRARVAELAPDLWSIRALLLDLPATVPDTPAAHPVDRRIDELVRRLAFQRRMRTDPWHARVRCRRSEHCKRVRARIAVALPDLTVADESGGLWIGRLPGEATPSLDLDLDAPLPAGERVGLPQMLDRGDPIEDVNALLATAAATWSQGWASETLELAERAQEQLRVSGEPAGPDRDRRLAPALELEARARRELGDAVGAAHALAAAVPMRERLVGLHGDDLPQRKRELARVLSLRGQLTLEGLDPDGAAADLEAALAIRTELVGWSDDPESLAELALSHSLWADALVRREPPAWRDAEQACRAALALRQRILDAVDAPRHRRQLGLAWGRLGRVLSAQLHLHEAEEAWTRAVAEGAAVSRASDLPVHVVEESVARTQLAAVRWQQGDRDGARREVAHAITQRRHLLSADPANARWAERLAVALGQGAQQALDDGVLDQALAWADEAVALGEQLVPATPSQLRGLALAHLRLGDVQSRLGDDVAAGQSWSRAEQLLPVLEARSPGRAQAVREALRLRGQ